MFGVVLWSDCSEHKAIIWCEDHGDLAYFNATGQPDSARIELEPGDLVRFDVGLEGPLRLAQNPRLVAERQYPTLAAELRMSEPDSAPQKAEAAPEPGTVEDMTPKEVAAAPDESLSRRRTATAAGARRSIAQCGTAIIIPFASGLRRRAAAGVGAPNWKVV